MLEALAKCEWNLEPRSMMYPYLGSVFKDFLFSPLLGEMIQFDSYFSDELKPPTSYAMDPGVTPNVR